MVKLSAHLVETYRACHSKFQYARRFNPRRVLTVDSVPSKSCPNDNKTADLILTVGDLLKATESDCSQTSLSTSLGGRYIPSSSNKSYRVIDLLGKGTFGQVVQCATGDGGPDVAVKVVKNKPAYLNQAKVEVRILRILNAVERGMGAKTRVVQLLDSFMHFGHLCLVFEMLYSNMYEVLKRNSFKGLPTNLVTRFTRQIVEALVVLQENGIVHCDLKPENIMLVEPSNASSASSLRLKVIDFGSSAIAETTPYTYIQSRFYRAPEVLIGCSYTSAIDMWSLGCIVCEMYLGLPIFPGVSEHNQLKRMQEVLGEPPAHFLARGKRASRFYTVEKHHPHEDFCMEDAPFEMEMEKHRAVSFSFLQNGENEHENGVDGGRKRLNSLSSSHGSSRSSSVSSMMSVPGGRPRQFSSSNSTTLMPCAYKLKSPEQWAAERKLQSIEVTKRYIKKCTLKTLVMSGTKRSSPFAAPSRKERAANTLQIADMNAWRACLLDLLKGLLRFSPETRWTAWQIRKHPFMRFEHCASPFVPEDDSRGAEDDAMSTAVSSTISVPSSSGRSSGSGHQPFGSSVDSNASVSFSVSPPNRPLVPGPFGVMGSSYFSRSPVHGSRFKKKHVSNLAQKAQKVRMGGGGQGSSAVPINGGSRSSSSSSFKRYAMSCPDHRMGQFMAGSGGGKGKGKAVGVDTAAQGTSQNELSPHSESTTSSMGKDPESDFAAWDPFYFEEV